MKEKDRLYSELVKAQKEMEEARNTWVQYDKVDPFAPVTRKAWRAYFKAENRQQKAFDAWINALEQPSKERI